MVYNDAPSTSPMLLKGKLTNRSWAQLPEEIIRLIATHYLLDISISNHCPSTWENRRLWPNKMVYTVVRDAFDIEKHLMGVCPEWHKAIAKHLFWKQAIHVIDYNDTLIQHMVIPPKLQLNASSNAAGRTIVLSHYQHFRNIIGCSCYVCRINYPYSVAGLAAAERIMTGSRLNPVVYLCRDHDRRRPYFCGLCLRDTVITNAQDLGSREYDISQAMGIMENEDEKLWDGIDSTCKKCRIDWLWKEAGKTPGDRDAIGGQSLQSDDWETRQCVDSFIELAEGSITEVLATAREKVWLKRFTKYDNFGEHALMAQKSNREAEGEEEEEVEDDRELMFMRDASQVRELALHDWARRRILDGYWICPADTWYRLQVPGQPLVVAAVHPCPWNRECGSDDINDDDQHPRQSIVNSDIPPTFSLCEQAYGAYMKQMREILTHPLRNLVRKIVMECAIPTAKSFEDPAIKVSRMSIQDVITILREDEGIWYDGVDWIERRRNEEECARRRAAEAEAEAAMRLDEIDVIKHDAVGHGRRSKEDDGDSTRSSSSSPRPSSHAGSMKYSDDGTSPVLSTSTLQTTPSPPPSDVPPHDTEKQDSENEEVGMTPQQESQSVPPELDIPSKPRIIPVDPVRCQPQLLSSIPYIPITTAHLPQYSMDAIKNVWRDVCAPLYHCRCSVCERAKMIEAAAHAAYTAATAPIVPSQPQPQRVKQKPIQEETAEIVLHEVSEIELDGEGEEEFDDDLEYDDDEDYEEDPYTVDAEETYHSSLSPGVNSNPLSSSNEIDPSENVKTSKKRSSDELDGDDVDGSSASTYDSGDSVSSVPRRRLVGTPPKRARLCDQTTDGQSTASFVGPVLPQTQNITSAVAADATVASLPTPAPTIKRAKKRSSEELTVDDDGNAGDGAGAGAGIPIVSSKRAKVDLERPRSLPHAPSSSTPGVADAPGGVLDRTIDGNSQRTIALDDNK